MGREVLELTSILLDANAIGSHYYGGLPQMQLILTNHNTGAGSVWLWPEPAPVLRSSEIGLQHGGSMRTQVKALVVGVVATLGFVATGTRGQTVADAAPAAEPFAAPRTSWGDPDLQGIWDYRTITPMERRPELGERAFYTDEEIAQLEGRAARRMEQPPDENTPANLVHAEYLTDPGRFLDESRRTSLIVEPANGRLPAADARQLSNARNVRARPRRRRNPAAARTPTPTGRCSSAASRAGLGARRCQRSTTTTSASCRRRATLRSFTRWCTTRASCRSTDDPFGNVRSYIGESRGRWEGDTLVVETRNFNGKAPYRGAGANLRVIERYTRTASDKVDFKVTFEDDTQWTQPWTAAYSMRPAEGELYEYACHEGNYGLRNILENARDEERKAAAATRR